MKRDRVLLSAILFSALWHLFWLSALSVVVAPKDTRPPQFSSVSFLGPILEESVLRVNSAVPAHSISEKSYLSDLEDSSAVITERSGPDVYAEAGLDAGIDIFESYERIEPLAISAIDGNKMEPGSSQ